MGLQLSAIQHALDLGVVVADDENDIEDGCVQSGNNFQARIPKWLSPIRLMEVVLILYSAIPEPGDWHISEPMKRGKATTDYYVFICYVD